jgi:hypothetical protein
MAEYGHFGSLGPSHMTGSGTMDAIEQIWWLAWTAHALPDVHSLFLGQGQNYPFGQNFGVQGSMVVLGAVFAPITRLFGVVVTWNILLRLAVAASASSMCLVLRRWTTWWPAAFLGGLLYGFSAYTNHLSVYLFLIFVPLPPLIFLLLHEILVRQQWRPGRTGVLLGAVCALQFFISTEVLASTAVMAATAVVLFFLCNHRVLVERWRYAVTAAAYGFGAICLLLFYPLWVTFAGPQHINGAPASPASLSVLGGDLLSPFRPDWAQWFDPKQLTVPDQGNGQLLYLGIPLVIVLALFAVFFRKRRAILFAGTMALIAFITSLGSRLWIGGHYTGIALPFAVIAHLLALDGLQATRFSLFTDLFAAGMFAIGVDELRKRLGRPGRPRWLTPRLRPVGRAVVVAAVAVVVIIPLVPSGTISSSPTNVPTFFTSSAVNSIPAGSVVLTYPYPDAASTGWIFASSLPTRSIMLDQSVAGMRFKIIGGYGWFPSPTGKDGTTNPALLDPLSVQALFDTTYLGGTPEQRRLLSRSDVTADLREFLEEHDVQTVIVIHQPPVFYIGRLGAHSGDTAPVVSHITAAIGTPVDSGGVTVWFHVKQRLAAESA